MSGRASFGGMNTGATTTRDAKHARDSNRYFPSGSILAEPTGPAFERSEPLQTLIDCLAVVAGFLLISATGVGIAFAAFVLLFVKI